MLFSGTGAAALPAVGPGMAGAVGGDEVRWKKINELITRATADTPTATKSRNLGDRGALTGWTVDVCFHLFARLSFSERVDCRDHLCRD